MKKVLLLTSLALCLSAPARAQAPAPTPAQTPAPITAPGPSVAVEAAKFLPEQITGRELRDLSGRAFRLSDFGGRVYVVNLWATWCGPCRLEIPGFNKIYEDYRGRGVEFVGLTAQDPEAEAKTVRDFVSELRMKYRIGWADGETMLRLANWNAARPARPGAVGIPQTFVVGADGHVVLRVRGYNPRVVEIVRAAVRQALELSAPPPAAEPAGAARR